MIQKHRIKTTVGKDQKLTVELKQDFDLMEILSLKLSPKDTYTSLCSDYGVVVGRVSINNGFGIPNAKVSIFIPLSEEDVDDPVISSLYPFKSVLDYNEDGYRYNLLPSRQQHGGHAPTGTFPDQSDILTREEVLEVYEKYYKFTVKTNESGDFMIWGVPVGEHVLHIDVDLSDIGCFSLRPYDFIMKGEGINNFKSKYQFKADVDMDSLPQIKTFNKSIEVYPFWGNEDLCNIAITRSDFDLSGQGIKIEPKAYLIGGTFTDTGKLSVNKNGMVRRKMGNKCSLTSRLGKIEYIRFTTKHDINNRPILEYGETTEPIDDNGSFLLPLPMNMDYIYTNEYGENEYTNDPNKGIATSSCYRLRIGLDNSNLERVRMTGYYLVPNIREYIDDLEKSYAFSLSFDDYPSSAVNDLILNSENGFYIPKDYFFRLTYNKVYTVSSFQNSYFHGESFDKDNYLGIKELSPSDENDCSSDVLTPPINFGVKNYTFQLFLADVQLLFEYLINRLFLGFVNSIIRFFLTIGKLRLLGRLFDKIAYRFQENSQTKLYLTTYPECEECFDEEKSDQVPHEIVGDEYCRVGYITIVGNNTNRELITTAFLPNNESDENCSQLPPLTIQDLSNSYNYFLKYIDTLDPTNDFTLQLDSSSFFYTDTSGKLICHDAYSVFIERKYPYTNNYTLEIYSLLAIKNIDETSKANYYMESGCATYDIPYDESIISLYYATDSNGVRKEYSKNSPPPDIESVNITENKNGYNLPSDFERITPSGFSEFSNGIFYIVPGSQTNRRLREILREYKRRKRVGTMFCGGIVNYSFIDNWLSGSLYFFQFKAKVKEKKKGIKAKYCTELLHYSYNQGRFYYRSTPFRNNAWGYEYDDKGNKRIYHPTTMVDLGPRDEFVKEICYDINLDPNCSVSRIIGATSYQDFGEMLGLAINYRMDTSGADYDVKDFFDNDGFKNVGARNVFAGDILQLISINNEAGIEEFDLQNPKYSIFSPQFLDPEKNRDVFYGNDNNSYGPLPITLELSDNGESVRACLNTPDRLGDSSQEIPFFLWDKKGMGFGVHSSDKLDNQSWDYKTIIAQPLQGMTINYKFDNSHKYLLLPITYNFGGKSFNSGYIVDPEFDIISTDDLHAIYNEKYPGFTYLYVTDGTEDEPISGTLYVRFGNIGEWQSVDWDNQKLIIKRTEDYYTSAKHILSTPFTFYFGLRPGKTGLDKLIEFFGPEGAFPSVD